MLSPPKRTIWVVLRRDLRKEEAKVGEREGKREKSEILGGPAEEEGSRKGRTCLAWLETLNDLDRNKSPKKPSNILQKLSLSWIMFKHKHLSKKGQTWRITDNVTKKRKHDTQNQHLHFIMLG